MEHPCAASFKRPVDPIRDGVPDYFEKIKHPMDFRLIKVKLSNQVYTGPQQFAKDVRLVFANCYAFNRADSDIVRMARTVQGVFDTELRKILGNGASDMLHSSTVGELQKLVVDLKEENGKLLDELQKLTEETQRLASQVSASSHSSSPSPQASSRLSSSSSRSSASSFFTFSRKEALQQKITILTPLNAQNLAAILGDEQSELELNFENMSDSSLFQLEQFVDGCLARERET